jgi:hypothetical protein
MFAVTLMLALQPAELPQSTLVVRHSLPQSTLDTPEPPAAVTCSCGCQAGLPCSCAVCPDGRDYVSSRRRALAQGRDLAVFVGQKKFDFPGGEACVTVAVPTGGNFPKQGVLVCAYDAAGKDFFTEFVAGDVTNETVAGANLPTAGPAPVAAALARTRARAKPPAAASPVIAAAPAPALAPPLQRAFAAPMAPLFNFGGGFGGGCAGGKCH